MSYPKGFVKKGGAIALDPNNDNRNESDQRKYKSDDDQRTADTTKQYNWFDTLPINLEPLPNHLELDKCTVKTDWFLSDNDRISIRYPGVAHVLKPKGKIFKKKR